MTRTLINQCIRQAVDTAPSYAENQPLKIAFVGHISSGKSALVNAFITSKVPPDRRKVICTEESTQCTETICKFTVNRELDYNREKDKSTINQKIGQCRKKISEANMRFKDQTQEKKSHEVIPFDILFPGVVDDELLKYDLCLIDTPALDLDKSIPPEMIDVLREVEIVVVTVSPMSLCR